MRPIRYERMKSNSNKPGLVKMELRCLEEKRALLRAKRNYEKHASSGTCSYAPLRPMQKELRGQT